MSQPNTNMTTAPESADMSKSAEFAIGKLAELKTLNRTQAEAYVLREIERVPRAEAADRLDISKSALDNRLWGAQKRLRNAQKTLDLVEELGGDLDE